MAYKIKVKGHRRKRDAVYRVKGYTRRKKREVRIGTITIEGKRIPIYEQAGYINYKLRPKLRGVTRTLDIGRPKRHQLIRVRTKRGWLTKSVRVQKGITTPTQTKEILRKAVLYQ